jgi:hypothetical protein
MSLEKTAAVERMRVLQEEIATLTDDINYYADVLDTKYVDMRHMYAARNEAWAEFNMLSELVDMPVVDLDAILEAEG